MEVFSKTILIPPTYISSEFYCIQVKHLQLCFAWLEIQDSETDQDPCRHISSIQIRTTKNQNTSVWFVHPNRALQTWNPKQQPTLLLFPRSACLALPPHLFRECGNHPIQIMEIRWLSKPSSARLRLQYMKTTALFQAPAPPWKLEHWKEWEVELDEHQLAVQVEEHKSTEWILVQVDILDAYYFEAQTDETSSSLLSWQTKAQTETPFLESKLSDLNQVQTTHAPWNWNPGCSSTCKNSHIWTLYPYLKNSTQHWYPLPTKHVSLLTFHPRILKVRVHFWKVRLFACCAIE